MDLCVLLPMVAIGYSVEASSPAGIVTPLTLLPAAITSVTYTMPASTLSVSTWVSTDFTSGCSPGGDNVLHVLRGRRGEDVSGRPAGDLGFQTRTRPEAELHRVAFMGGLELLSELGKRFRQRCSGEHGYRPGSRRGTTGARGRA